MSQKKRKTGDSDDEHTKQQKRRKVSSSAKSLNAENPKDANGISQCFHLVPVRMFVTIAPMFINNPQRGVEAQHLEPLLMSYFSKVKGIVLAYSKVKLLGSDKNGNSLAKVIDDSPFSSTWVYARLLVWRPNAGDVFEAYVNMQSPSHIGLLLHDTFNATVHRGSMPPAWTFIPVEDSEDISEEGGASSSRSLGYWTDEFGNKVDGMVRFTAKSVSLASKVMSVEGTIGPAKKELSKYEAIDQGAPGLSVEEDEVYAASQYDE